MRKLSIVLVLAVVIFLFVVIYIIMTDVMMTKSRQTILEGKVKSIEQQNLLSQIESEPTIRLSNRMTFLQLYTEKLGLAGKYGNWPLATYYTRLIRQELEAIEEMDIIYNNNTINTSLRGTTLRVIDEPEQGDTKSFEGFASNYKQLVHSCNACHQSVGAGFIKVQIPTGDPFVGQLFKPSE